MIATQVFEHLARFGFSGYESRAYTALLQKSPLTGYELAKHSGVPPSKVYEVIEKLLSKSVISPTGRDPVKYLPQSSDVLLKKFKDDADGAINALKESLPAARNGASNYIWNIHGRAELLDKALEVISVSRREILLSCWDGEAAALSEALQKKVKINVAVVLYGAYPLKAGAVYHHRITEVKAAEKGGREFTLVSDGGTLLQAVFTGESSVTGVWTTNPSLVGVAADFIRHDIYCWKMIDALKGAVEKKFGKDYRRLRNIFSSAKVGAP